MIGSDIGASGFFFQVRCDEVVSFRGGSSVKAYALAGKYSKANVCWIVYTLYTGFRPRHQAMCQRFSCSEIGLHDRLKDGCVVFSRGSHDCEKTG
jgi:hypothetical protein